MGTCGSKPAEEPSKSSAAPGAEAITAQSRDAVATLASHPHPTSSDGTSQSVPNERSTQAEIQSPVAPWRVADQSSPKGVVTIVDPYDLTARLKKLSNKPTKSGGFSDVYEGELQPDGQKVAIKSLRAMDVGSMIPGSPELENRLDKRLQREMRVWRPLTHPRIVPCLGFAMVDERPSLVSPWYKNGNAREYIKSHPNCNRGALLVHVAEGLVYLHTRMKVVVHYDVKSLNVLITDEGTGAITDFGIAKVIEEARTGLTTSNSTALTLACSSPEAVEGKERSVKSDVYSFGCFALEIMSGNPPYYDLKGNFNIINAKSNGVVPNPKNFPELPESDPLWDLFRKCWHQDPQDRPTMPDVLAELHRLGYQA